MGTTEGSDSEGYAAIGSTIYWICCLSRQTHDERERTQMMTQDGPFPPEGQDGRPLEEQLEELGKQLGFYVEVPNQTSSSSSEIPVIKVAMVYHRADSKLWQQVHRHLELVAIPGWNIQWTPLRLSNESSGFFIDLTGSVMSQSHLVLLALSIDLVETITKKYSQISQVLAGLGENTVVCPVLLRPVFWTCPFPTLESIPTRAVTLWKQQDAAHAAVAKRLAGVLEGIRTFLEEDASEEG